MELRNYDATEVQHRRNTDNSIGYRVISKDPDDYRLMISAFYFNEEGVIIGFDTADTSGSREWDHMEIPSVDYDSYVLVWAYEDL